MKVIILYSLLFLASFQSLFAGYKTEIVVAQDGSGDHTSIQEAINATKSFPDKRITIFIKNGIYNEKVKVHSWNTGVTIVGESQAHTIIRWDDYFDKIDKGRNSTFYTATLQVEGDAFVAKNLTIENTAGDVGQAIALAVIADNVQFINCSIKGYQDSLYAAGSNARQFYKNCFIEGSTDFIFGEATALFYKCVLHSKSNSFITAASTTQGRKYGFVFLECKLTADNKVSNVFLGRPWRRYAKTVFIKCEMQSHINPLGWDNWSSSKNNSTVYYAEFSNFGPGAKTKERVSWSHQLKKRKAKKYTLGKILSSFCLPEMTVNE